MVKFILSVTALSFALINLGCSLFGIRSEPTPEYKTKTSEENFEIRKYAPMLIASTEVSGNDYEDMQGKAFRTLADYIFGENLKNEDISMTAPVLQDSNPGEDIPMTAPVLQSQKSDRIEMSFVMPSKYESLNDLPRPKNDKIEFKRVPERTVAVVTFSGLESKEKNQRMAKKLKQWLNNNHKGYEIISSPTYAGYDPPWTIPFFRRNEIMLEVKPKIE